MKEDGKKRKRLGIERRKRWEGDIHSSNEQSPACTECLDPPLPLQTAAFKMNKYRNIK